MLTMEQIAAMKAKRLATKRTTIKGESSLVCLDSWQAACRSAAGRRRTGIRVDDRLKL